MTVKQAYAEYAAANAALDAARDDTFEAYESLLDAKDTGDPSAIEAALTGYELAVARVRDARTAAAAAYTASRDAYTRTVNS